MNVKLPGFKWDARTKVAHFAVIIPGTGGRTRRRTTVSAETRADALRQWSEFHDFVLKGTNETDTFAGYFERNEKLLMSRLAPKTAEKDLSRVRKVLMPFFGDRPLPSINLAVVKDFASHLRTHGYPTRSVEGLPTRRRYSPASINDALAVLKKILRDASDRGEISANLIRGRWPREKEPVLRQELNANESRRFRGAFADEDGFRDLIAEEGQRARSERIAAHASREGHSVRLHGGGRSATGEAVGYHYQRFRDSWPVYVVALETGLRKGDLLGLSWPDVYVSEGWIRVVMQKTRIEAVIPISAACREALLTCRSRSVVGGKVFVNDSGDPFSEVSLRRYFLIAKRLAGITRPFRFHDLRHTFASNLASAGVPLYVISKALGHTSTRMTERYARPSETAMRSIVAALDGAMNSTVNSGGVALALGGTPRPFEINGLPGGDRTHDPRLRRPMLLSS